MISAGAACATSSAGSGNRQHGTAGDSALAVERPVRLREVPLPVAIVVVGILIPQELDIAIAGLQFTALRLALLVLVPIVFTRLYFSAQPQARSWDYLMLVACSWYWLAGIVKGDSPITGGTVFIECMGGYLIARAYIHDARSFAAAVRLILVTVLVAAPLAFLESVLHQYVTRNLFAAAVGAPSLPDTEIRMGLARAMFVFEHPIAYGAWGAGAFALVWWMEPGLFRRLLQSGGVAFAAFCGLSSAPLIGIGLALAGVGWERATRGIAGRVAITLGMMGAAYLFISLVATRSISQILTSGIVFDPWNAYYRTLIWEFGIQNVIDNPIWGASLVTWERPSWMPPTVDNYWLAKAMAGGVPCLIAYVAAIGLLVLAVGLNPDNERCVERQRCRNAWLTSLLVLCFIGITVHFWRVSEIYFCLILGMGGWMAEAGAVKGAVVAAGTAMDSGTVRKGLLSGPSGAAMLDNVAKTVGRTRERKHQSAMRVGTFQTTLAAGGKRCLAERKMH